MRLPRILVLIICYLAQARALGVSLEARQDLLLGVVLHALLATKPGAVTGGECDLFVLTALRSLVGGGGGGGGSEDRAAAYLRCAPASPSPPHSRATRSAYGRRLSL